MLASIGRGDEVVGGRWDSACGRGRVGCRGRGDGDGGGPKALHLGGIATAAVF